MLELLRTSKRLETWFARTPCSNKTPAATVKARSIEITRGVAARANMFFSCLKELPKGRDIKRRS